MRNIKLTLEYDGRAYAGWQIQPGLPTVQGTVESVLSRITDAPVRAIASGRTDAGTHALGQVANFTTHSIIDNTSLVRAMNSLLPDDIAAVEAVDVAREFHARYSALSKTYRYLILNRERPSPFYNGYAWHVRYSIDLDAMAEALNLMVGEKDFSSFRAASCSHRNPVRNILRAGVERKGEFIRFEVTASSFLQHMVRIIVGTMMEVGRGKMSLKDVEDALNARDRATAGPTATSSGLYLVEVNY